ncbi:hypothetical protein [Krasilnikovia sp. MM14-A1259]|uniref:hypothetical protein n=1 Tax=Krasilnikovia sp. MM14-A1259 TaxID=3373539 RepID=UPI00399CB4CD
MAPPAVPQQFSHRPGGPYAAPRPPEPDPALYERPADGGGKRRADITAVDLGYTGRRSRPDDVDDEFGYGPEPGHPGYGVTAPDPYDEDPLGDDYDWRQPSGDWHQRSRW